MGKSELYDDIFFVWKGNSGAISSNDGIFTEIVDFQIPRGYAIRVRKVIVDFQINADQADQEYFRMLTALVLDPDDETSTQIPTFTIDHDVCADFAFEFFRIEEDTTPNGISGLTSRRTEIVFPEELDVVSIRNARVNTIVGGMAVGGDNEAQTRMTIYFTYEKVSTSLYEKLLGIK
ncbi:unnamed protein product [marine sediment metagenome]|uniref:Uncharacterized protein n=1 Tax=marine sediment metagenome TaxID=412755 RepID=X0Z2D7_9ZZZZ